MKKTDPTGANSGDHTQAVYVGVGTMVVNYRNQRDRLANEVLIFDDDLVREGHGTYMYPESERPTASWP
ncbi:hypothetical protein LAUMK13_05489 [Mycobacterium innocens]|uniref:Uncharacterized protein n=1 Tax=Mycobacterium innocens TaxID=2341083 RepID=A0A498QJ59_9MYCO|nr:hypothetical protein LAUMK13_05489 [Mycobacterium innocens]